MRKFYVNRSNEKTHGNLSHFIGYDFFSRQSIHILTVESVNLLTCEKIDEKCETSLSRNIEKVLGKIFEH